MNRIMLGLIVLSFTMLSSFSYADRYPTKHSKSTDTYYGIIDYIDPQSFTLIIDDTTTIYTVFTKFTDINGKEIKKIEQAATYPQHVKFHVIPMYSELRILDMQLISEKEFNAAFEEQNIKSESER